MRCQLICTLSKFLPGPVQGAPSVPESRKVGPYPGELALGGEGDRERSACGGLHTDPEGQSGKGSGGHLLGAPWVTEEETVAVQVKNTQATWPEGQWQLLQAGLLAPRPALQLPRHSGPRLYCLLSPARQLGGTACHSVLTATVFS